MEPTKCNHTLHAIDTDGVLTGSWETETIGDGLRVVCRECGKFYGRLRRGDPRPLNQNENESEAFRKKQVHELDIAKNQPVDRELQNDDNRT